MGAPQKGRWVWYDLMTKDVDAAKAFYTETIGWKVQVWEDGPMPYSMWCVGEQSMGGVMPLPPEAGEIPPHWLGYAAVDDVDATVKQAGELGGKVLRDAFDIPTVGRIAVLADPQGAAFAVFKAEGDMPLHDGDPRHGDMSWHELNTTDWEAAWKFYESLLGWQVSSDMDMGPEAGTYRMYQRAGAEGMTGGMSNVAKTLGVPAHWLYYTTVDDLDAAVKRIESKGGTVVNGPMEVPGGDRIAQCRDPQGAFFAVHWKNPNPTPPA